MEVGVAVGTDGKEVADRIYLVAGPLLSQGTDVVNVDVARHCRSIDLVHGQSAYLATRTMMLQASLTGPGVSLVPGHLDVDRSSLNAGGVSHLFIARGDRWFPGGLS